MFLRRDSVPISHMDRLRPYKIIVYGELAFQNAPLPDPGPRQAKSKRVCDGSAKCQPSADLGIGLRGSIPMQALPVFCAIFAAL